MAILLQTQLVGLDFMEEVHTDGETKFKAFVDESHFGHCCFLVGDNSRDSSDDYSHFFDSSRWPLESKCPFFNGLKEVLIVRY